MTIIATNLQKIGEDCTFIPCGFSSLAGATNIAPSAYIVFFLTFAPLRVLQALMKQPILPTIGTKAEYGAPQSRIIRISAKAPIMSLSNPTPGAAGYYNDDDDIVIPDAF